MDGGAKISAHQAAATSRNGLAAPDWAATHRRVAASIRKYHALDLRHSSEKVAVRFRIKSGANASYRTGNPVGTRDFFPPFGSSGTRLLHRHALREVTRFIHITAKMDCEIIGKKLEGNHR